VEAGKSDIRKSAEMWEIQDLSRDRKEQI